MSAPTTDHRCICDHCNYSGPASEFYISGTATCPKCGEEDVHRVDPPIPTTSRTTWQRATEIVNTPAVHEAVMTFCHDQTDDNAVCAVQSIVDEAIAHLPAEVTQQPAHPELLELLHRGLRTWETPPAWAVQWHDRLTGVPAPVVRQVTEVGVA